MKEVLEDMKTLVSKLNLEDMGSFNYGYRGYAYKDFVLDQKWHWDRIIDFYKDRECNGIIDIGTFVTPYYPVVLKRMGFNVEVVEKTSLYGRSYEPVAEYLYKNDIRLHDMDIMTEKLDNSKSYDVVALSILEHLNGSPKTLIENSMGPDSLIYIMVPNMCRFYNVTGMLTGRSPLPAYRNYYYSKYPFEGHNRPMTLKELKLLAGFAGLKIVDCGYANKPLKDSFWYPLNDNIGRLIPRFSNELYLIGQK